MRVLFLNYEYPPLGGGAANATRYLLEAWAAEGELRIDLVCASPGAESVEHRSDGIASHRPDIGRRGTPDYQRQAE